MLIMTVPPARKKYILVNLKQFTGLDMTTKKSFIYISKLINKYLQQSNNIYIYLREIKITLRNSLVYYLPSSYILYFSHLCNFFNL